MFRLSLSLFWKRMFFARTNGNHSSGAEKAHGLPNRNSHNARHSNRPSASCARMKAEGIGIIMFVEILLMLLILLVFDCLSRLRAMVGRERSLPAVRGLGALIGSIMSRSMSMRRERHTT